MDLHSLFQALNAAHFESAMPPPRLNWNGRLRSSAGRFSPGSRNPLRPREPLIEIASYLSERHDGEVHIKDTMLHEMIHYWLWFQKKPYGHTPEFHALLKRVGAQRYNPVPKLTAVKYWYECPKCAIRTPARRRLGSVACLHCCKRWNQGKYSEQYRLRELLAHQVKVEVALPEIFEPSQEEENILPFEEVVRRLDELREIILKTKLRV